MAYSVPDCFMAAFAAGLVFGLVYEVLRIIRLLVPLKSVTFVCDILFFLLAASAVTKLSLALGNYIRGYTVLGFGAGVFCYITTLGRLMNLLENAVMNTIRAVITAFFRTISHTAGKLFGAIAHKGAVILGKIHKFFSQRLETVHNPLKSKRKIVYNKESHKDNNGGSDSGHVIKAEVRRGINT